MKINLKGKKVWGVAKEGSDHVICLDDDKQVAARSLDKTWNILVEFNISKVLVRNPEFIEVEF